MTATTHDRPISAASDAYLAAVGVALAGVPDSDRQELLDDLAEHLAELAHETDDGLTERLGPPEKYAAELLASAGIEPAPTTGIARLKLDDRFRRARELFDSPRLRGARAFANDLRPGWWVVRAWLVLAALAARSGLQEALWIPHVTGSTFRTSAGHTLFDLAVLAGAVAISVRIGRGPKWAAWIATTLGILALFSVVTANRSYFYRVSDQSYAQPPGVLIDPNGREIDNIFAYDASGKPIPGVFLGDQNGAPLDVGNSTALQENGVSFISGRFPQPNLVPDKYGVLHGVQPKPPHFTVPFIPQATTATTVPKPKGPTTVPRTVGATGAATTAPTAPVTAP